MFYKPGINANIVRKLLKAKKLLHKMGTRPSSGRPMSVTVVIIGNAAAELINSFRVLEGTDDPSRQSDSEKEIFLLYLYK